VESDRNDAEIYTINAFRGRGKTKLIDNNAGEAGPSWGSRP